MTDSDSGTRTLVIVAIVGLCVLCGLGGLVGVGGWFFYRAQEQNTAAEQAVEAMRAEQESRKRAWLESLPVDERAAIDLFDRAERRALQLVGAILDGTADGPDELVAERLRERAAAAGGFGSLSSPSAETTEVDGRTTSVSIDVTIPWADGIVTTVRVRLRTDEPDTMTASTIEIVDAPE